jgi:hypothetical protein
MGLKREIKRLEYLATPFFANTWTRRIITFILFASILLNGWTTAVGWVIVTATIGKFDCVWNQPVIAQLIVDKGFGIVYTAAVFWPLAQAILSAWLLNRYIRWATRREF